jgi:hypothetical protein
MTDQNTDQSAAPSDGNGIDTPVQAPLYAFVANGDVLYTKQSPVAPDGPEWRLVVDAEKPPFDPETQECVQNGWAITESTASQTWQVLDKPQPGAPVVLAMPPSVPESVSLRQFRMALRRVGLFESVKALETNPSIPAETQRDINDFIEYSNTIERRHPLIVVFAPVLGVTQEQIDAVFVLASTL